MGVVRDDTILAFCHVTITGGQTLQLLLRRHFGLRHMELPRGQPFNGDRGLEIRVNPFVRSLAGHSLRPYLDFGPYESRLRWYTFLREPVSRYISHYQLTVEKHGSKETFEDWMRDPVRSNRHVHWLAGEPDLEAAKQILATKIRCVGLTERYNESLLLIRHHMHIQNLVVAYGRRLNPAWKGETRKRVLDQFDRYRDDVHEQNRLDLELYDYAVRELYPRQVRQYGEAKLKHDLEVEFAERNPTPAEKFRYWQSVGFRKGFFLPYIMMRRKVLGKGGLNYRADEP